MAFALHTAGALAALVLLAASFIFIIAPGQARELLKRLAAGIAGLVFCVAMLAQVSELTLSGDFRWIVFFCGLCVAAWAVVKLRGRNRPRLNRAQARERLPGVGPHLP